MHEIAQVLCHQLVQPVLIAAIGEKIEFPFLQAVASLELEGTRQDTARLIRIRDVLDAPAPPQQAPVLVGIVRMRLAGRTPGPGGLCAV
ncbi:MAG: hypothetical protein ACOY4L_07295 [Pseudomonadota bacterium]